MPLHPKAQWFVEQIAEQGRRGWHEMPVSESRELFESSRAIFGKGPSLPSVTDECFSQVQVRVYRPALDTVLPVMMYFHGGGWVIGSIETHDSLCRRLAQETGRAVVSVDYRLAPEHKCPAALDDCYEATKFVAEHADQLQVDASDLVLAGDSAGGNLAAGVSLRSRDEAGPSIRCQILIYPVVEPNFETESYRALATGHGLTRETMRWFWEQYLDSSGKHRRYVALASAELNGSPPTHVITAEYDVLRDEGEQLVKQLTAAGVATTHKRYDGMLHGFVHFGGIFDDGLASVQDIAEVLSE